MSSNWYASLDGFKNKGDISKEFFRGAIEMDNVPYILIGTSFSNADRRVWLHRLFQEECGEFPEEQKVQGMPTITELRSSRKPYFSKWENQRIEFFGMPTRFSFHIPILLQECMDDEDEIGSGENDFTSEMLNYWDDILHDYAKIERLGIESLTWMEFKQRISGPMRTMEPSRYVQGTLELRDL